MVVVFWSSMSLLLHKVSIICMTYDLLANFAFHKSCNLKLRKEEYSYEAIETLCNNKDIEDQKTTSE